MPREMIESIVGHSEYAQDPLHDRGEAFPALRPDDEMEVIAHNTEVLDSKIEFCLSPLNDSKEKLLHRNGFED